MFLGVHCVSCWVVQHRFGYHILDFRIWTEPASASPPHCPWRRLLLNDHCLSGGSGGEWIHGQWVVALWAALLLIPILRLRRLLLLLLRPFPHCSSYRRCLVRKDQNGNGTQEIDDRLDLRGNLNGSFS